jgi:hypothetical protein
MRPSNDTQAREKPILGPGSPSHDGPVALYTGISSHPRSVCSRSVAMEAFITRKRKRPAGDAEQPGEDDEPTDVKLAILSSLHPGADPSMLLDVLTAHDGSVAEASAVLGAGAAQGSRRGASGYQSSLRHFAHQPDERSAGQPSPRRKPIWKKGATMHLYDPVDVAEHTPCTIIHNFLPPGDADELLRELLAESESYKRVTFKLFENVVTSPHSSGFYVESYDEMQAQKSAFLYNGARLEVDCLHVLILPSSLAYEFRYTHAEEVFEHLAFRIQESSG